MNVKTSTVSAGLAWGVPVRPEQLGWSLEAFEKALPVLHTFRLCQRFGRGRNVHVPKLPVETMVTIEDLILVSTRKWIWAWEHSFKHYERRCDPYGHAFYSEATPMRDIVMDLVYARGCKDCRLENDDQGMCPGCRSFAREKLNTMASGDGRWIDVCQKERAWWLFKISHHDHGAFVKYDKVSLLPFVNATR